MHLIHALLIYSLIATNTSLFTPVVSTPVSYTCPVTQPVDGRPDPSIDPFVDDASLFYENGLWVTIPEDGIIELEPEEAIAFGKLEGWRSAPVTWLRDKGIEGFIEVTGQRLDEESDLRPQTPLSPQRQYVRVGSVTTGLAFPGEGCWEVTGSVGNQTVTLVVQVDFLDGDISTPDSTAFN